MELAVGELAARVAGRTRAWPLVRWYWGDAITVDGLLEVDDRGLAGARDHVLGLVRGWLQGVEPGPGDVLAPGAALARLEGEGELPASALDRFLGCLERLPRLYGEVPALEPQLPRFRFGVCIDAAYHLPPALAAAGRLRQREDLVARAVTTFEQILERLACPGGWAQWYDAAQRRNNGVPWTRGIGWALLGALDTAHLAQDWADTSTLLLLAREMVSRLAEDQGPSGHWGPVLGRADLPDETSVAAFFVAAAGHPAAPPVPPAVLAAARAAVISSLSDDGVFLGVSADVLPSFDVATYEHFSVEPSPWGQGAALRALTALDRLGGARSG